MRLVVALRGDKSLVRLEMDTIYGVKYTPELYKKRVK